MPNVLLVVVDTLGAEHLGAYGGGARTPNVDRLAAEGVRFDDAIATAPWTQPSIASLFTSLMPSRHGVVKLRHTLSEERWTLAEALAEDGRTRTHAVVSHVLLAPDQGYAQGFAGYDTRATGGHAEVTSEAVTDGALAFLEDHAREAAAGEPFFLFVHYFDPHYVYRQHPTFPHTERYDGPVRAGMPIWDLRDMRDRLGPEDVAYLVGLYHEEIAFTDFHVGRLLDGLRAHGFEEDTLVIFTADHGEEFMGHGWIGHTRTLYDELVRVPLIVRLPGRIPPGVVEAPVSLLDVAPTVLQLVGRPVPEAWEGRSLLPLLLDPRGDHRAWSERFVFSEVSYGPRHDTDDPQARAKQAHKTALVLGELKLIHDQLEGRWELYRRDEDPGEQHDLAGDLPGTLATLRAALEAWEASVARGERWDDAPAADEDLLEELRRLGYVR